MLSTRTSRRSTVLAVGASASLLMAFAANGAMAAPTPAPTGAAANAACPAAPGVTPTTIDVGWVGSKTGPASTTFIGASEGAQLRFDQENAKGGVNGRKIKLKVYDDQTSPTGQVTAAQKAIGDNVFGLTSATSTVSMYPTLKSAGIPIVGFTNAAFGTDNNAFGITGVTTGSNPTLASTGVLEKMKQMGATKLAIINHSSAGATASQNALASVVPFVPGITTVLRIADSPQGAHDATSEALRIKNSGADAVNYSGFIDGGISLAQALKQQGVTLKSFAVAGLTDPAVLKTANGALDGALGQTYGPVPIGVNVRAVKTFASAMKAAGLNPYAPAGPVGYLSADLFIKGLKVAGKCPTRESFISNLRKVNSYDGAGLIPAKVSFVPGGLFPNGNPITCGWYTIAKGNDLVPDAKATCGGKYIDTTTGKVVFGS
ncbi:MAG: ABC transporter substrate-binding protein [Candidatus Nanopelagicales bacterium]|nr:ABC transporter substrate-binding protein [Candidatus Nanopelagicales bacterium]